MLTPTANALLAPQDTPSCTPTLSALIRLCLQMLQEFAKSREVIILDNALAGLSSER